MVGGSAGSITMHSRARDIHKEQRSFMTPPKLSANFKSFGFMSNLISDIVNLTSWVSSVTKPRLKAFDAYGEKQSCFRLSHFELSPLCIPMSFSLFVSPKSCLQLLCEWGISLLLLQAVTNQQTIRLGPRQEDVLPIWVGGTCPILTKIDVVEHIYPSLGHLFKSHLHTLQFSSKSKYS